MEESKEEEVSVTNTGLDPEEMRRRRLARLQSQTAPVNQNQPAPIPRDPPAKISKQLIPSPKATLTTDSLQFAQSSIAAITNIHKGGNATNNKTSDLEIAKKLCGMYVTFTCSESEFSENLHLYIGDGLMDACLNLAKTETPLRMLGFLSDLHGSANVNSALTGANSRVYQIIQKVSLRYTVLLCCDYFSANDPTENLLYTALNQRLINISFISPLVGVILEEFGPDCLSQVFVPLFKALNHEMSLYYSLSHPRCEQSLSTLNDLCELTDNNVSNTRPLMDLLVTIPNWLPPPLTVAEGRELQRLSFLGSFLSISVISEDDPQYAMSVYANPDFSQVLNPIVEVENKKIQNVLSRVRLAQFNVLHLLLVNQKTRTEALDFLANCLTRNTKRAQMHPDMSVLATHGFMLNLLSVLCSLEKKVSLSKVDPLYLCHPRCRFDSASESHMRMDAAHFEMFCEETYQHAIPPAPKFSTECFFFTLYACHLGIVPCIKHFISVVKSAKQLKSYVEEAERKLQGVPGGERRLGEVRSYYDGFLRNALTLSAVLTEGKLLSDVTQFYAKVMDLILMSVLPSKNPRDVQLPLSPTVPNEFASFPDFIMEDISEMILFCLQYGSGEVLKDPIFADSLVNFLVTFLCSSNYISNPYLVAKLVEVLYALHPGVQPNTADVLAQVLDHSQAANHLAPSLISFYSAIETTGSTNEFYEKFSIRYHLTIIFKLMWANFHHKNSMITTLHSAECVRFVNLLINDTTFLLDESLESIRRIHEIQTLLKNTEEWAKLTRETQSSKRKQLAQDEAQCKFYMTLVNETLAMLHYISLEVQKPFLLPEIIFRFAAMLDSYLVQFCGPRYNELNVENRGKYRFQPKTLLTQIIELYLHLDSPELAKAIAADERSYREDIMVTAGRRMKDTLVMSFPDQERFARIARDAKQLYTSRLHEDQEMDDAPEHFRDPITEAVMDDPVELPSGKVIDRSSATRILLDNAIDPFSRAPMTREGLKECPQLKEEIARWVQQKGNKGEHA